MSTFSSILLFALLNTYFVSSLKLQQQPEFDTSDSEYDEECGDRMNYKCWKKGGHGLDREEAAFIKSMAWAVPADAALATSANKAYSVTVTWNKKVAVVKSPATSTQLFPVLKVCDKDAVASARSSLTACSAQKDLLCGVETSSLTMTCTMLADAGTVAENDAISVEPNALSNGGISSIKNAGKSHSADVSYGAAAGCVGTAVGAAAAGVPCNDILVR